VLALVVALGAAGQAAAAPNLVVVMADDLSSDALDALLAGGWMPNLQQHLVDAGVTFQNSFVTHALCCPSRATFLTGQYAHNHRVFANISALPTTGGIGWPGWLPSGETPGHNESTIATWLQSAGYTTGFVGKYLNGYGTYAPASVPDPRTYVPPGWSDWHGLIDPSTYRVFDYELNENGTVVSHGGADADYQTDVLAARAVEFVEAASSLAAPFFLSITPLAPHVEVIEVLELLQANDPQGGFGLSIRPAPRHADLADGDPDNGEMPDLPMKPSFNEADVSDKPSCPAPLPPVGIFFVRKPYCIGDYASMTPDHVSLLEHQWKTMLASMLAVDDLIGSLVDALTAAGELDDTVLVFTSDNGWFYGEHRIVGKVLAYEEAIRVPLVIRAPGLAAGATAAQAVVNNDLAPTLAELGGVVPPYDPDGASLVPILEDPAGASWHRRTFLIENWFIPGVFKFEAPTLFALRSIRPGLDYLYVGTQADPDQAVAITHREFYNMATDPYQVNGFDPPGPVATIFAEFVRMFRLCRAESCRTLESF
jgi:N-acetylglucosamine-6-sulfatase